MPVLTLADTDGARVTTPHPELSTGIVDENGRRSTQIPRSVRSIDSSADRLRFRGRAERRSARGLRVCRAGAAPTHLDPGGRAQDLSDGHPARPIGRGKRGRVGPPRSRPSVAAAVVRDRHERTPRRGECLGYLPDDSFHFVAYLLDDSLHEVF